jgi:hypothetical protein
MLDMKDGNIVDDELQARAIVTDVDATSVGKTMQEIFTVGPNFFEAEDNQNLDLTGARGNRCGEYRGGTKGRHERLNRAVAGTRKPRPILRVAGVRARPGNVLARVGPPITGARSSEPRASSAATAPRGARRADCEAG